MATYGLQSSLWRKIRKNHPGLVPVMAYDKEGKELGEVIICRYENLCYTSVGSDGFWSIDWGRFIRESSGLGVNSIMAGNDIPICHSTFI